MPKKYSRRRLLKQGKPGHALMYRQMTPEDQKIFLLKHGKEKIGNNSVCRRPLDKQPFRQFNLYAHSNSMITLESGERIFIGLFKNEHNQTDIEFAVLPKELDESAIEKFPGFEVFSLDFQAGPSQIVNHTFTKQSRGFTPERPVTLQEDYDWHKRETTSRSYHIFWYSCRTIQGRWRMYIGEEVPGWYLATVSSLKSWLPCAPTNATAHPYQSQSISLLPLDVRAWEGPYTKQSHGFALEEPVTVQELFDWHRRELASNNYHFGRPSCRTFQERWRMYVGQEVPGSYPATVGTLKPLLPCALANAALQPDQSQPISLPLGFRSSERTYSSAYVNFDAPYQDLKFAKTSMPFKVDSDLSCLNLNLPTPSPKVVPVASSRRVSVQGGFDMASGLLVGTVCTGAGGTVSTCLGSLTVTHVAVSLTSAGTPMLQIGLACSVTPLGWVVGGASLA